MAKLIMRLGHQGVDAVTEVNRALLDLSLREHKKITLDIDATFCASQHKAAQWSYKKATGYMPMVGHIAETGQVLDTDFRAGNVAPAARNVEFIKQCEAALPGSVVLGSLRIDAAGYQINILDDCIKRGIEFAIRAVMSPALKTLIKEASDWEPLVDRKGKKVQGEETTRLVHSMEESKHAFEVVIQRKPARGQQQLPLEGCLENCAEELHHKPKSNHRDLLQAALY